MCISAIKWDSHNETKQTRFRNEIARNLTSMYDKWYSCLCQIKKNTTFYAQV